MSLLAQIDSWLTAHGLTERDCSKIDIDRKMLSPEMYASVYLDLAAFRMAFRVLEVSMDDTGTRVWYQHDAGAIVFKAMGEEINGRYQRKVVMDEVA
jgi:hypothetical protein